MKNIVFLRSNQVNSDSRAEKYLSVLDEKNIDYIVFGWDRNDTGAERKNTTYYRRKVGYVVGGLKAAKNRLYWFNFVIKSLRKMEQKPEFIHACDLDCAFPAVLYKIFFNKKVFILFDVFDWFSSDMPENLNPLIRKSILWMEKLCLKHSNKLFICEDERRVQIPNDHLYDISIFPNIPMIDSEEGIFVKKDEYQFNNGKPTLSYVGWFGNGRSLAELFELASTGKYNLLVAGYGNDDLVAKCNEANKLDNVKYFGKVDYRTGLNIQYNADIVYAIYCKISNNHIYAAPNKYYEAMFLGKPLLTTSGIIVADKVRKNNTGYDIEESKEDFLNWIDSLDKEDIRVKGENARKLWIEKYATYTHDFLNTEYMDLIK